MARWELGEACCPSVFYCCHDLDRMCMTSCPKEPLPSSTPDNPYRDRKCPCGWINPSPFGLGWDLGCIL
ncbi:uncharacterized protein BDW47DRAFT_64632 [Aspergillus candidus]|uniref:Uncharacterized protein n=1 Tax=Aspergillus candidus TaxID=41067 RepID=A0A2I2F3Q9_ASPCN|nr:hypothetical protein BDW47DRAFT_64632 [Aspergillus candidus]PLB35265.1 hypothetical protein BDW47DRAFT_64632 [Aspergillus candidus]